MKLFIIIMLFLGILLVVNGIYEENLENIKKQVKVEYRFVPRSYYDEMLYNSQFNQLLDQNDDGWYTKNTSQNKNK